MAKFIEDVVYDAALDKISGSTRMHLCSGQPTSWADCLSKSIGAVTVDSLDFTITNGDTSGRKAIVGAQVGFNITRSDTLDHVAFINSTDLLCGVTHTPTAVVSGDSRNTAAFDIEMRDPL